MRCVVFAAVTLTMLAAGVFGTSLAQEATPSSGTANLMRTDVRYVLPFGGDGLNSGLTVRAEETGSCAHESLSSPGRPDAWNCVGETSNAIYDPCFQSPFSTPDEPGQLACVDSPFGAEVVLFTPTSPLSRFKEAVGGPLPPQPAAMPAPGAEAPPIPTGDKPLPGVPAAAAAPSMPAVYADPAASEPLPWAFELADGEQCTLATGATAAFAGMRVNYFCTGGGSILGEPDRSLPVWAVTYLAEGAVASELVDVAVVWH